MPFYVKWSAVIVDIEGSNLRQMQKAPPPNNDDADISQASCAVRGFLCDGCPGMSSAPEMKASLFSFLGGVVFMGIEQIPGYPPSVKIGVKAIAVGGLFLVIGLSKLYYSFCQDMSELRQQAAV